MFFPIGDDIEKRNFPTVGIFLIVINVGLYIYTFRLWMDNAPKESPGMGMEMTTDDYGNPSYEPPKPPEPPPEYMDFMKKWGLVPKDLFEGKWMGLFSYMFLHGDVFHVMGNMIMLWAFVSTLENALGSAGFLGLYLLWGVLSGLAHAAFQPNSELPMIGASGAVSGMIGAYFIVFGPLTNITTLLWLWSLRPFKFDVPASGYVVFWVLTQLLGLAEAHEIGLENTGVAWMAHAGGFAAGLLMLWPFKATIKSQLVLNRHGKVEFRKEPLPAALGPPGEAGEPAEPAAPETCPYCQSPITEAPKLGEKLLKCPNPRCNRLIYLG